MIEGSHRKNSSTHGAGWLLLTLVMLAGCRREEITVYRVPKEKEPEVAAVQGEESSQPQIQWKTPPGWEEQPASGMSLANFSISGEQGHKAQLSIMTFPGESAGELSLINVVRENAGLSPVSDEELARLVEVVNIGSTPAKLVDLTGAINSSSQTSSNRILVAVTPRGGTTWFFKLAGDAGVVTAQKSVFLDFLKSIAFVDSGGSHGRSPQFTSTNAKPAPPGASVTAETSKNPGSQPSWEIPAGWREVPPSEMLRSKFVIDGNDGKAEVTVSAFPGDTGGVLANVNRWRGQVGLAPVDQTEADRQVTALEVMGGKAMLVDVSGQSARTGQKARLIGVIVPRGDQTWFYKLMGDDPVAGREKDAFIKFVQSARYPNV